MMGEPGVKASWCVLLGENGSQPRLTEANRSQWELTGVKKLKELRAEWSKVENMSCDVMRG